MENYSMYLRRITKDNERKSGSVIYYNVDDENNRAFHKVRGMNNVFFK